MPSAEGSVRVKPTARVPTRVVGEPGMVSWEDTIRRGSLTPYFETDPNPAATRRLLLVFFYFPPSAEVGALRWLSLSRFGAERGWAIDVVSLHAAFMGTIDPTRLRQLPPGIRVFGFSGDRPAWYRTMMSAWWKLRRRGGGPDLTTHAPVEHDNGAEPYHPAGHAWRRVFRSRAHFALADVLARRAAAIGAELTANNRYDVVVSSGPPHAAHEAAKTIAARARLPLVLDMRDPWSDESAMPDELRGAVWRRETRARERACVSAADLVVVTSQAHEELQRAKYPDIRSRIVTVMNGADSDPLPVGSPGNQFVIAFTGLIYLGRNPRPLFRAAARVARATGASPNEFAVEFMGGDACEGVPLTTIAREEGLGAHFRSYGFRPRREALELLSNATLLVSLPLRTEMTLPAKLFEYTRFDAWLLALADSASATARLLADTDADVVPPDDVDAIAGVIANRFAQFRAGVRPVALNRDGRFDRATQSARLFDALEELSAPARQR
ncbi:MAG TPA: hypothetical protein VFW03_06575 [Gemmatimonadaceae bacterium]|nr:hypothetical protein [Gemmatimonadaceae bacterium]